MKESTNVNEAEQKQAVGNKLQAQAENYTYDNLFNI